MCLSGDEWVMKMWCAQWYTQWDIIQPLEGNPAVFNNLDESWGHYAKWNKTNAVWYHLYVQSEKAQLRKITNIVVVTRDGRWQ